MAQGFSLEILEASKGGLGQIVRETITDKDSWIGGYTLWRMFIKCFNLQAGFGSRTLRLRERILINIMMVGWKTHFWFISGNLVNTSAAVEDYYQYC